MIGQTRVFEPLTMPRRVLLPLVLSFSAAGGGDLPPPRWSAVNIPPPQVDRAVASLDRLAADLMKRSGVPGMAVAVVHADTLIYVRGFGRRKAGSREFVDADTVFQLASVSKPLGATVVAAAAGRGGMAWDQPIVTALPWFRLADPYVSQHVTVGDLYSHRSGLPDHAGDSLEDLGFARAEILERLRYLPLEPFRVTHTYTNFGLTAAAEAVAAARGSTWSRLSEDLIYRPLGMTSTSSRFSDYAARHNKAVGHVREGSAWIPRYVRQPDAQSPAGGASSSVRDMARWMQMVLAEGSFDSKEIVARKALMEALTPQIRAASVSTPADRASLYGYGFGVGNDGAGRVRLSHSGGFLLGASTSFTLLPAERLGIITLTNGMPVGVPEALNASFVDLVETGAIQRDWLAAIGALFQPMYQNQSVLAGQAPPSDSELPRPLVQYTGRYANAYYGEVRIATEAERLVMTVGPKANRFRLSHWAGDQFAYHPAGETAVGIAAVWFRADSQGQVSSLEVENFEKGVRLFRKQLEHASQGGS